MRKFVKLLSFTLAFITCFLFTACSGETTTQSIKNDLIASAQNTDLSSGVLNVKTIGSLNGYEATLKVQSLDSGNMFDFYLMSYNVEENITEQNKRASALFLRNDKIYTIFVDGVNKFSMFEIASSNYEVEVQNHLKYTSDKVEFYAEKQAFYDSVADFFEILTPAGATNFNLPHIMQVIFSVVKNSYALNTSSPTKVYNGYRLSVDIVKSLQQALNKLIEIGETIDGKPTITIEDLINSQQFTDLFKSFLESIQANVLENLVKFINYTLANAGYTISFEELKAYDLENAYDYLIRFVNTKVQGLTIASLRIFDLVQMMGYDNLSFKEYFSELRITISDTIKKFTDTLNILYTFDLDKNLVKLSIDFNLKKSSSADIFDYENIHVKIDFTPKSVVDELLKIS